MDDAPFAGKTAIVTGGAKRIGRIIALRLGTLGCNVAVHYKDSEEQAAGVVSHLKAKGVKATAIQADLAHPEQCLELVAAARRRLGGVDFLVNNASTYPEVRLADLAWKDLAATLKVDAWAPVELMRAVHQQLKKRGGATVNLLDARIADHDLGHAGYYLAKRMLADLTRMAAIELAPQMRVSAVAPGPILPPPGGDALDLERWAKHLPLRRTPASDDVADAVLYLLGAHGVTGEIIHVDGGRHLGRAVYG
ncbi:MAG TPA: SDR family oxidoreductase [Candidatus Thermoplasmatota archaeon]|nr:SDR family oxidoreductase [Candidatus Thermoplasmatota archaeon]